MTKSILMVKPQHVELRPEPIRPEWIISGNPVARSDKLATSHDHTSNVIVWACTPGQFQWRYSQDETVVIIAGEAFITGQDGIERRIGPGELAFFPAGTVCTWRITETIRKAAVLRETMWGPFGFLLKVSKKVLRLGTSGSAHGAGTQVRPVPAHIFAEIAREFQFDDVKPIAPSIDSRDALAPSSMKVVALRRALSVFRLRWRDRLSTVTSSSWTRGVASLVQRRTRSLYPVSERFWRFLAWQARSPTAVRVTDWPRIRASASRWLQQPWDPTQWLLLDSRLLGQRHWFSHKKG